MPRILALYLFSAIFLSAASHAQEGIATVTFYSHGAFWTNGIPGVGHDVYFGNIFDGVQGIFKFRDGYFVRNNRFITLHLPAGQHIFGASYAKKPESRETLEINLEAGGQYFIRAQGSTAGVPGVFTLQHGRLDLIACSDAQLEMQKAKPLKEKALWTYTRARIQTMVVNDTAPPVCE